MFEGKSILITGGTGSFGKKMTQVILQEHKPARLVIFSRDELKQFEMSQRWSPRDYPCLQYMLGDVRDAGRVAQALKGIDIVIHAAALKQVPAAENNPCECIKTNVVGATNIIDAAIANKVSKVIALSTDKACNPINLYGATKLCADKLFAAANHYSNFTEPTFSVVRYGNVLGSRGSVVPFFQERKATGKLPITDPRMTRFWITLDQAVHFTLNSFQIAKGGEIFVPKIPAMNITDLARAIAPECEFETVGIRPGEKLHETLVSEEDARITVEFDQFYIVQPYDNLRERMLSTDGHGRLCPDGFHFSSDNCEKQLSVDELRVAVENIADDISIEKSRWSTHGVPQ